MVDLTPQFDLVEACIKDLGVDPAICRGEKPGQWSLVKGSAKVWIDCWYIEREARAYFQVMSPVMKIPTDALKRSALYEELLTINDKLFAVAFTIYNNWVWLKVIRETDGMDQKEAFALLTRIGNYADQYDDDLIAKFGDPVNPGGSSGAPGGSNV